MSTNKTIIRVKKSRDFVTISRFTLEDNRLSWEARGLYAFLLAKPDNWNTCVAHLIKCSPARKHKVRRILNELIDNKYIEKEQPRRNSGLFLPLCYIVHEMPYDGYLDSQSKPQADYRPPDYPDPNNPAPVNPPLINIQNTKEDNSTKNTTTTITEVVWPSWLSEKHRKSISTISMDIETVVVQLLLDEVHGQRNSIKNPVGYFHALLHRYRADKFIPAKAIDTQQIRETRTINKKAIENANQLGDKRLERLVKQQRSKKHG